MSEAAKNPNLQNRSPAQLSILAAAREKAKLVRSENAKLKAAEKEVLKMEKEKEKEDKKKDIATRMDKLKGKAVEETEPEPEPEAIDQHSEDELEVAPTPKAVKRIKKTTKKKVVVVEESDSSEDEEIVYVTKSKPKPRRKVYKEHIEEEPVPVSKPVDIPNAKQRKYVRPQHEHLYQKMFKL